MIERLKLADMVGSYFCMLNDKTRFDTPEARTIELARSDWRRSIYYNLVQTRTYAALKDIQFSYADDCSGVGASVVEGCLDKLEFDLGDISPDARSLIVGYETVGSAAKLVRWLKAHVQGDVMLIEGKRRARLSFSDENDFILTRLQFC